MTEEVRTYLQKLMNTVDGLLAIVITDRDGVPLLKGHINQMYRMTVAKPYFYNELGNMYIAMKLYGCSTCLSTDQAPELALRHNFLCTFGTAAEQASKIGLKQSKSVICMYQNYQVVQIDKSPLVVTFIANVKTNTGLLLNLESDMKDIFNDLSTVITN